MKNKIPSEGLRLGRDSGSILCDTLKKVAFSDSLGGGISLLISLVWATVTTYLGIDDERIWNSFFLQYLWEFVLGMWLAKIYFEHPEKIKVPMFGILLVAMIVGVDRCSRYRWWILEIIQ